MRAFGYSLFFFAACCVDSPYERSTSMFTSNISTTTYIVVCFSVFLLQLPTHNQRSHSLPSADLNSRWTRYVRCSYTPNCDGCWGCKYFQAALLSNLVPPDFKHRLTLQSVLPRSLSCWPPSQPSASQPAKHVTELGVKQVAAPEAHVVCVYCGER